MKMNEGRKTQIILLDERRLDIIIQPKLYTCDLLDLVASHFKLREKQYFGLAYVDETLHYHWLQSDKRVLDHDLPKKSGTLQLNFSIRFYVDTIGLLRDTQTVELFYFNARQAIFRGQIECDSETVFELAAHVLQASKGDFASEDEARGDIKKLPIIPSRTWKEHPSITFCEDKVIGYYKKLLGTSRGLAIVNYMTIVEKLPTYGIHYYEVKDKKEIPWWLGISPKGIAVYDRNDKTTPRRVFTWKNLENLYYRDKKFSIEVHDPKRIVHTLSSFNLYEDAIREPVEHFDDLSDAITDPTTQVSVSRRTFGTSSVNVHAWLATSPQLTKCIWSMAVAQHQFYLDKKQSKGTLMSARSMSEIAADLCRSTTSLVGSDLSRSESSQSLPSLSGSRFELNVESSESQKVEREMYQALKARKEALEEALRKKLEEFKILCLQEGELTGTLPKDTPLDPGERVPTFRRRVGTSFAISPKAIKGQDGDENRLATLELEYELQSKITSAAHRLAQDKSASKYVRKQRRQSYNKAAAKLKDMEKKLEEVRKQMGKSQPKVKDNHRSKGDRSLPVVDSAPALLDSKMVAPPHQQELQHQYHHHQQQQQQQQLQPQYQASPAHQPVSLSPSHSSPQLTMGYMPSSVYETRTQYRSQAYPTLSSSSSRHTLSPTSSLSPASVRSIQDDLSSSSLTSSSNNLYNVTLQQTSRYESTDLLKSPSGAESQLDSQEQKLHLPSKHGSLDRSYRRGDNMYGSLDRKKRQQGYSVDGRDSTRGRSATQGYSVEPRDTGRGRNADLPPLHLDIKQNYNTVQSQGDFTSPQSTNKVELPVYHEKPRFLDQGQWRDGAGAELSHPQMALSPESGRGGGGRTYDRYSPQVPEVRMGWEEGVVQGKPPIQVPVSHHFQQQQYHQQEPPQSPMQGAGYNPYSVKYEHQVPVPVLHIESHQPQHFSAGGGHSPQPQSPTSPPPAQSTLVTSKRTQPHMEMIKPYETSDFYKYSERLRKQRIIENYQRQLIGGVVDRGSGASTPSQSSDSDSHSLHSSHSGSSLPMRLAAASAAYYGVAGTPTKHGGDPSSSRGAGGYPPHFHRQEHEQTPYSHRGDQTPVGAHQQGGYPGYTREQTPYSGGQEVSTSEYQTVRSHGPSIQFATARSHSSYTAQYMHAVASAKHSHYQPPAPMTCRPVTDQGAFKGGGGGGGPK